MLDAEAHPPDVELREAMDAGGCERDPVVGADGAGRPYVRNANTKLARTPTPFVRRRLLEAFQGRDVSIDELEEFVITQTPYRETHIKKPVLVPMENAAPPELQVVHAPLSRRRGKYPKNTVIRFL
jgi:hypothetical protein